MSFTLDPKLEHDTHPVCELGLSRVLLMDNVFFPWLILVPRVAGLVEIGDLAEPDRTRLWAEICDVSNLLKQMNGAHKMNVAILGNEVRQLHVHIIARHKIDVAWPSPVWGAANMPYGEAEREAMVEKLRAAMQAMKTPSS